EGGAVDGRVAEHAGGRKGWRRREGNARVVARVAERAGGVREIDRGAGAAGERAEGKLGRAVGVAARGVNRVRAAGERQRAERLGRVVVPRPAEQADRAAVERDGRGVVDAVGVVGGAVVEGEDAALPDRDAADAAKRAGALEAELGALDGER